MKLMSLVAVIFATCTAVAGEVGTTWTWTWTWSRGMDCDVLDQAEVNLVRNEPGIPGDAAIFISASARGEIVNGQFHGIYLGDVIINKIDVFRHGTPDGALDKNAQLNFIASYYVMGFNPFVEAYVRIKPKSCMIQTVAPQQVPEAAARRAIADQQALRDALAGAFNPPGPRP